MPKIVNLIVTCLIAISCLNIVHARSEPVQDNGAVSKESSSQNNNQISYKEIYKRIYDGKATLNHVKQALRSDDPTKLVNTMHALYAMRLHRSVYQLLYNMWELNDANHKDINWELISEPPVRIALASTINRIDGIKSREIREYIRSFKYDDDDIYRGQVLVALGLNGDPIDVPYIEEMADSDNRYLTQIGVSSLAFMGNGTSKQALITLANKHYNTPRGKLIVDVLKRAYNVVPTTKPDTASVN